MARKGFQARSGQLGRVFYNIPFASLRGDPRYADLRRRRGRCATVRGARRNYRFLFGGRRSMPWRIIWYAARCRPIPSLLPILALAEAFFMIELIKFVVSFGLVEFS